MQFQDYRQTREAVLADTAAALRLAVTAVEEQRAARREERESHATPYVEWAAYESQARNALKLLRSLLTDFEAL